LTAFNTPHTLFSLGAVLKGHDPIDVAAAFVPSSNLHVPFFKCQDIPFFASFCPARPLFGTAEFVLLYALVASFRLEFTCRPLPLLVFCGAV